MRSGETIALVVPLLAVGLPLCLYLAVLTVAAPFGARRRRYPWRLARRFAILVPAHNEEPVLARLLTSLEQLTYPRELIETFVVADNCTDATDVVARTHGAFVFRREDAERVGKGYALQWLLDEMKAAGRVYDAYVVLDADSVVSPNLLAVMNSRLDAGARVVQAYYTVLPLGASRAEALREAALALVHFLRPAAKTALGLSCGLKGNGMCFDRAVIDRFGWPSAGLAEDVEFHLMLVAAGMRVIFASEALVWAEMPISLQASQSQNLRWEAGRLATIRSQALPLLLRGLRARNLAAVDAAFEQLVPPLSVTAALVCAGLLGGVILQLPVVWLVAGPLVTVLAAYVLCGLLLARVRLQVCRVLPAAPIYVGWKVILYLRALRTRGERRWVRTQRSEEALPPPLP